MGAVMTVLDEVALRNAMVAALCDDIGDLPDMPEEDLLASIRCAIETYMSETGLDRMARAWAGESDRFVVQGGAPDYYVFDLAATGAGEVVGGLSRHQAEAVAAVLNRNCWKSGGVVGAHRDGEAV
jgi:hypothetical protein